MLPMAIAGVISWMSHKSNKTNTVEINEIKLKEWMILVFICIVAFIGLYNLLKYFNTSQLLVSTISMIASLLALYLLVRRSKYCFIFYILNDIILIILWGLPIIAGNLLLIPMLRLFNMGFVLIDCIFILTSCYFPISKAFDIIFLSFFVNLG